MHKENLRLIADHMLSIKQPFELHIWRVNWHLPNVSSSIECLYGGCALGQSVILDKNSKDIPRLPNGDIHFVKWGEHFTGLDSESFEWRWCFGSDWRPRIEENTPLATRERILQLIEGRRPANWWDYMTGHDDKPITS